jgi:hypothetical protein
MRLFGLFEKNPNEKIIQQISEYLFSTDSFIYFSKDNFKTLLEYKKFEAGLFAAAIHKVILETKFGTSISNNDNQAIKKIYIKNTSNFFNTYIKSGKIGLSILSLNNIDESRWLIEVFVKFNDYVEDARKIFKERKTYFVEEWDETEYDEEVGFEITGQKIYHNFINKILLCEIETNRHEMPYIKPIDIWTITDEDAVNLQMFVDKVHYLMLKLSN